MSKNDMSGTYTVPVSPGATLAELTGWDTEKLCDGLLTAPESNAGNLTKTKTSPLGSDTTFKPGQSTTRKVFRLGSVTLYSTNGTDKVVLDGVEVDPHRPNG